MGEAIVKVLCWCQEKKGKSLMGGGEVYIEGSGRSMRVCELIQIEGILVLFGWCYGGRQSKRRARQ